MTIKNLDQLTGHRVLEASQQIRTFFSDEVDTEGEVEEKLCVLKFDNGILKIQAPYTLVDENDNPVAVETLIGYVIEFVDDFYDAPSVGKVFVFENGTRFMITTGYINMLQNLEKPSHAYEVTFTDLSGNVSNLG